MRTAVLLAAGMLAAGCGRTPQPGGADSAPAVGVRVAAVRAVQIPSPITVPGTVLSVDRARIAAKISGQVTAIPVTLGQSVRKGDVLVRISADDAAARVKAAIASFLAAKRDLEREKTLFEKNLTKQDTVDKLTDQVAITEAQLRDAEETLGFATIRAPFDGTIARRPANAGDLATPGLVLLELNGDGAFEIEASVPESAARFVATGAKLLVRNGTVDFLAAVAEVSRAADPTARTIPVKLTVPVGGSVRAGEMVRIEIPGTPRSSLLGPASAVASVGQMERVFVVDADGRANLRIVRTAPAADPDIEFRSGVADGERVVLNPPAGLRDGQRVRPVQ